MSKTQKGYVILDTKNGTVGIRPCPSCGAVGALRPTKVGGVHELDMEHEATCSFLDELEAELR